MSELMDVRIDQNDFRWRLLTTVSALALIGVVSSHEAEAANDEQIVRPCGSNSVVSLNASIVRKRYWRRRSSVRLHR